MTVSIITATYNSGATVRDTLTCVRDQGFANIEHLVIDGKSEDNTLAIVSEFPHVKRVISEPDSGIYDAMNKGIKLATGEIIGILNSDDYYPDNNVIGDVVEQFQRTGCDAVYADLVYIDPENNNKILRKWKSGRFDHSNFMFGWMPPHPTFFVRKEVYDRLGVFDTRLKSAADYELLVRFLYINKISASYLPRVTVHMRPGGVSNRSFRNWVRAHLEDYKAWSFNGVRPRWYTVVLKPMRKILQYL